jgi:hypothetical protein
MAYETGQLRLLSAGLSGASQNFWVLDTEDDLDAGGVLAGEYVSDGDTRGMNVGDLVVVRKYADTDTRTTAPENVTITAVSALSSSGATLKPFPAMLPTYTVAGLPTAGEYVGGMIYVSNGAAGDPVVAFSDGTNWLRVDTKAAVAAS